MGLLSRVVVTLHLTYTPLQDLMRIPQLDDIVVVFGAHGEQTNRQSPCKTDSLCHCSHQNHNLAEHNTTIEWALNHAFFVA
jgi:hypothetical protein